MKNKLIYGIGINDSTEPVSWYALNGKREMCKIYSKWVCILQRCYSDYGLSENPSYRGVTICDDWKYFTKFKSWVQDQKWEDLDLDKDILKEGNKVYSPDACCFVPKFLNIFLKDNKRGDFPLGVHMVYNGKFKAQCRVDGKVKCLGTFKTVEQAHKAWQTAKIVEIEKVLNSYSVMDCFRTDVAESISTSIWKVRLDLASNKESLKI